MTSLSRLLFAGACALAAQSTAFAAAPHATAADARTMLDRAVAEINTAGADKAFAEFDQKSGTFNTGELYVFVFGLDGKYEATGANPTLVGTDASALTDAEGHQIVQQMIEIARTAGSGKVNYVWLNRADNRIEHKMSLIELVGDHVVGVGYYPN